LATWFTQLGLISPRACSGEFFVHILTEAILKAERDNIHQIDIDAELEAFDAKHYDLSVIDPPEYHQRRKQYIGRLIRKWIKANPQQD